MQDKVGHTLRVANRIVDRDGTTGPQAQQGEPLTFGRLDDCLQILDLSLKREIRAVTIGRAGAARVVTDERMGSR